MGRTRGGGGVGAGRDGPVRVMLLTPKEGIWRDICLGVVSIAAARGWRVELNYPMFHFHERYRTGPFGRVAHFDPHVLVITGELATLLDHPQVAGRILVSVESDLTAAGVSSVVPDNDAIGREAAGHLIRRGFRSFAAWGLQHERFAVERTAGFVATVEAAGLRFATWPQGGQPLAPSSGAWMDRPGPWFDALPRPTGVLACCDSWAHWLAALAAERDISVPEELAIVSVDNDALICDACQPPVSSVIIPWQKLGNEAGLLIERLLARGPGAAPPERVVVGPAGVATRRSSDTTAAADPDVAAALGVIRRSADRPLSVRDILREVPIYRQRLERKFRRTVGRTILEEVRRVHVEQAKRLLATTDLSMPQVAERSGFPNSSKLAINFRKETGTTPTAYRRRFRPGGT